MSFINSELAQLADVVRGITFPTGAKNRKPGKGLVACLRTTNVQSTVEWDDLLYVDEAYVKNPEQFVRKGDILVSMSNSLELVGKCAFITDVPERAAFGAFVAIVRARDGIDPSYLFHALRSPAFRSYVREVASTTTNISNINSSKLIAAKISLFGPKTNKAVADKIDELFSRIDEGERALERVQKLVERYRLSVLKAAVTGELTREWREKQAKSGASIETSEALLARILTARREAWEQAELGKMNAKGIKPKDDKWKQKYAEPSPPDTSELPELPEGWVWASVIQVCCEFGNGLSKKPSHTPPGYPILRISAVRPLAVDAEDIRYYPSEDQESLDGFLVDRGDLLFTRYNGSKELVGVSGVFHGAEPVLHPDKLIRARVVSEQLISPEYLAITLNCGWSKKHLDQWVKTSAGQHGIAGSDIKRAPFPLPPFSEQRQILEIVEVALSKCADAKSTCSAQFRRSSAVRQSILKSAFAGALVAQDSSDEPAAALVERITSERRASPAKSQRNPKIKKTASK